MKAAKILIAWAAAICTMFALVAVVWVRWGGRGLAYWLAASVLFAVLWAAWRQAERADEEIARRFAENDLDYKRRRNAAESGAAFRRPRGAA